MKIHLWFRPPPGFTGVLPFSKVMPNGLIRCDCGSGSGLSYANAKYKADALNTNRPDDMGTFFVGDDNGVAL